MYTVKEIFCTFQGEGAQAGRAAVFCRFRGWSARRRMRRCGFSAEAEAQPERFEHLDFRHFFLQPLDGPRVAENTRRAVEYCLAHPSRRVSLRTHKLLGLR